jgi:hypothetical protein
MIAKEEEIVKKIKSRGYWEINVRPNRYPDHLIEKQRLKEILRNSAVLLRGWDYPHVQQSGEVPFNIANGIEMAIEWESHNHIEFWRFTQSGNFYHLLSVREDWLSDSGIKLAYDLRGPIDLRHQPWIGVIGTLYSVTEFFEFAKRLAIKNALGDEIFIEITLHGLANRILVVEDRWRLPLLSTNISNKRQWKWERVYKASEFITRSADLAVDAYTDLVWLFQWKPDKGMLEDTQEKFLAGRM